MIASSQYSATNDDAAMEGLVTRLCSGHMVSAAMHVALELDLADRLANGPRNVTDLAAQTAVDEGALYRVLRALASVGVFLEQTPRVFALTRAATLLGSGCRAVRDQLRWMVDPLQIRLAAELAHSVSTGKGADRLTLGASLWDLLERDARLLRCFQDAMTGASCQIVDAVLQVYDFSDIRMLVDVGGGHGHVIGAVLQRFPAMCGALFDRADVVAGARQHLVTMGVAHRCRVEAGDFFASLPRDGDAYLLQHIIHDWDDESALAILRRVREAIADRDGRLLLIESPITAGNRQDPAKFADLAMLVCSGGRERTVDEYGALCRAAGFDLNRAVPAPPRALVFEGRPI